MTKHFLLMVASFLTATVVHAEISGSGSPNAGCANGQIGGRLQIDTAAVGIPGITLHLANDEFVLTAISDADGRYTFGELCEDDYLLAIDFFTVPTGLTLSIAPDGDDGSTDDGPAPVGDGWEIQLEEDDEVIDDVDFGFSEMPGPRCALDLQAGCAIGSLATEVYVCSKRVNELRMMWSGDQNIRVIAHEGNTGDAVVLDVDDISPGGLVTVSAMQDPPDDVVWEILAAGSDIKLGESKFHLACDDPEMDGPEDCLLPQGDGKDNKDDRINDWTFYGLADASGSIDCSEPTVTQSCEFQPVHADCDLLDKVFMLTMVYTGGDCATSRHHQPDKFQCSGGIDATEAVSVTLEDNTTFVVEPGQAFTVAKDGSDTEFELRNSGGTQTLKIHTSCSAPLAAGDSYGGLLLGAINGLGVVAPVDFQYVLSNTGDADAGQVIVYELLPTLSGSGLTVGAQSSVTLHGSGWAYDTTTNIVVALGGDAVGQCGAADLVTAVVQPRAGCYITELEREYHDKEIRWRLQADGAAPATVERVEIGWPANIAGKLKEMLFDGDKFFDTDVSGGSYTVQDSDLEGEVKKRRIRRDDDRQLKIKFEHDIEDTPGHYDVTVHFEEGCSVSW